MLLKRQKPLPERLLALYPEQKLKLKPLSEVEGSKMARLRAKPVSGHLDYLSFRIFCDRHALLWL